MAKTVIFFCRDFVVIFARKARFGALAEGGAKAAGLYAFARQFEHRSRFATGGSEGLYKRT